MGVDAVEPDVVISRDGVLVVRHENEISSTTDVADHPEFADRRVTKTVDGEALTGWFTEDFTWAELSTLRCRERLPAIRPSSASFDDQQPILRLVDVLELVQAASLTQGREIGVVLEIKHATYFDGLGLRFDLLVHQALSGWRLPLVIEAFESTVLEQLRQRGVPAAYVYLIEATGRAFDLQARLGAQAPTYRATVEPAGLDALVGRIDGISVDKRIILAPDRQGRLGAPTTLVNDAHERGLQVFTWTCRPENTFLIGQFAGPGGPAAHGDYEGEWGVIRASGVDGVFVDHADLGVAFFRR